MHRGVPHQPEQVRDRERVSGDSSSPHSVLCQRCVSMPWAQQELWKLANPEAGLPPRSTQPDEGSVSQESRDGLLSEGKKAHSWGNSHTQCCAEGHIACTTPESSQQKGPSGWGQLRSDHKPDAVPSITDKPPGTLKPLLSFCEAAAARNDQTGREGMSRSLERILNQMETDNDHSGSD